MHVLMQAVQPRRAKVHTLRERFLSLTEIDFSACENVRNRNMAILAASHLKLRKIAIGHVAMLAQGKPRITNSVSRQGCQKRLLFKEAGRMNLHVTQWLLIKI